MRMYECWTNISCKLDRGMKNRRIRYQYKERDTVGNIIRNAAERHVRDNKLWRCRYVSANLSQEANLATVQASRS